MSATVRPLAGRRVVTTRQFPGRLDSLLTGLGADVVHVPLIDVVDVDSTAWGEALARFTDFDWVVVTSRHGAARVGGAVHDHPSVKTAAVGSVTAATLAECAGRPVDVVPDDQRAESVVAAMPAPDRHGRRVLVAQADRADPVLVDGLRDRGFDVEPVVVYSTRLRTPDVGERRSVADADAVVFASGSAARAWADAFGPVTPPHVIVIGPTTGGVASDAGLTVTAVADDHSVDGLVAAVVGELADGSSSAGS